MCQIDRICRIPFKYIFALWKSIFVNSLVYFQTEVFVLENGTSGYRKDIMSVVFAGSALGIFIRHVSAQCLLSQMIFRLLIKNNIFAML